MPRCSYDFHRRPRPVAGGFGPGQPDVTPALEQLYRGFERELLVPLWTEIGDLMPRAPASQASPHLWRWDGCVELAGEAGDIVPVGRGGERRAIALANPSLGGRPFATPTLWAAIQYLMPGEDAPEHRHTQHAFRFVVEGEGVWTVVNGDPVRDVARRLPAAGRLELARPPQRDRPSRWPGSTASTSRSSTTPRASSSSSAATRSTTPSGSRRSARAPSGCGATRACARWRRATARCRPRRCSPTAGRTPTARSPTSSRSRTRGIGGTRRARATPRSATPTRPPAATCCRRSAAEMHRIAPRRRDRRRPRDRLVGVTRSSTAPAPSTVGERRWTVDPRRPVRRAVVAAVLSPSEAGATDSDSGALDLFRFSDAPDLRGAPTRPPGGPPMRLATIRTPQGTRAVRLDGRRPRRSRRRRRRRAPGAPRLA